MSYRDICRTVLLRNPVTRRLDYIKSIYSPEVYERVEDAVARALGDSDVDEGTYREWEKQLPVLAANLNRINKRYKRGAISLLDARVEQDLAEEEFLEQAAPDAPMIPRGSEFVTDLSRGHYVVKASIGPGKQQLALLCQRPRRAQTHIDSFKDVVDRVAPFQQWLGEQMGNCLKFYSDNEDYTVSGCEYFSHMIKSDGNLYAVIRSSGRPKIAILTYNVQGQEAAFEYYGKSNTPADEDLIDEFFDKQVILHAFSFSQGVEDLLGESTKCLVVQPRDSAHYHNKMDPLIALDILFGLFRSTDPIFESLREWADWWPSTRSGEAIEWVGEIERELSSLWSGRFPCEWAALATVHGLQKASDGLRSIYEFCSKKYAMTRDAQPHRGPFDVRWLNGVEIEPAPLVGLESPMDHESTIARIQIFESYAEKKLGVSGISLTHGILGPDSGDWESNICTPWELGGEPFTEWTPQLEYEYIETANLILDGIREFAGLK